MGNLGAAYVEIAANVSKLDAGLKTAKSDVNKFLKGISKDMESLNFTPLLKNIAMIGWQFAQITAPVTVVTGALFALQKHTANVGEELSNVHEKTGISVEALYSLRKVLELDGLTTSDLIVSFKTLSKNLVEAKSKAGDMRNMFKLLDIDTSKPLLEIFLDLAKSFSGFADGEDKIALATLALGKSGSSLIPTLNELGEKGLHISRVFGEDSAKAAKDFNDNLVILKQIAEDVGFSIGNKLIPATNRFLVNMQSAKGIAMEFFPEIMLPLQDIAESKAWKIYSEGVDKAAIATWDFLLPVRELAGNIWRKFTSGATEAATAVEGLKEAMKGITSMKDLPFVAEGKPFQPETKTKKQVPAAIFIDSEKEKKDAEKAAKEIADAYKGMYNTLKYESDGYIEYKARGYLEEYNQNVKLTGDMALAWEVFYSEMKQLEDGRGAATKKKLDEEKAAARVISETYKEMYDSLGYDSAKYYEFQKGLLEKRRDEEILITGDMALAWEVYYARLRELDEKRMERSNSMADGMRLFFSEIERNGFTVAKGTKEMLDEMYSGAGNSLNAFLTNVRTGNMTIKESFLSFALSMQEAFIQAVQQMIVKWLMFKALTAMGGAFGGGAFGGGASTSFEAGSGAVFGHSGGLITSHGVISEFHSGGLSNDERLIIAKKGEFILRPEATKKIGVGTLHALNRMHEGGEVIDNPGSFRRGKSNINQDSGSDGNPGRNSGRPSQVVNHFTFPSIDANSTASFIHKNKDVITNTVLMAMRQNHPIRRQ